MLRWWLGGLQFGPTSAVSKIRTGQIYGAYVRFLYYSILFSLAASLVAAVVLLIYGLVESLLDPTASEIVFTALLLGGYVIAALAYSTIYQVTVKLGLWRLALASIALSATGALDRVKVVGRPSSSFGEGLASALHVDGW
jgi:drug/metabolite transporter superfamily protein YnfA